MRSNRTPLLSNEITINLYHRLRKLLKWVAQLYSCTPLRRSRLKRFWVSRKTQDALDCICFAVNKELLGP